MKMFEIISSAIVNWFVWVILGIAVGTIVQSLDKKESEQVPTFIASIVGAITGGFIANLIFEPQIVMFSFSAFLLSLSGAFLLSFIVRILRIRTEEEVGGDKSVLREDTALESNLIYYSDIKKPQSSLHKVLDQVDYPISSRDLLRFAEKSGIEGQDLNLLENLPDHIYKNKQQVTRQLKTS